MAKKHEGSGSAEQQRAEAMWNDGREALAAGDYGELRKIDADIENSAAGTAVAERARKEREQLSVDHWALRVGLATFVVYIIAWIYALS